MLPVVLLMDKKRITAFSNLTEHKSTYRQEVDKCVGLDFIKISLIRSYTRLDLVQQP